MRALLLLSALFLLCIVAYAQDTEEPRFKVTTTLSYNGTGGNTDTNSAGWKGETTYTCSRFILSGGGNYAMATADGEKTAESVSLNGGVDVFIILERLYGLYNAIWERNTFAGLEHRISNLVGVGVIILNNDMQSWKAETGAKYFYEIYPESLDLAEDNDKFVAAHVGTGYVLTPNDYLEFKLDASYDIGLENTDNQLISAGGSISVFITPWLAFNVGETLAWDNRPVTGFEELDYTSSVGLTLKNY